VLKLASERKRLFSQESMLPYAWLSVVLGFVALLSCGFLPLLDLLAFPIPPHSPSPPSFPRTPRHPQLLEYEPSAMAQVELLLQMDEKAAALEKATRSGDMQLGRQAHLMGTGEGEWRGGRT